MLSVEGEQAVQDAQTAGRALLKFLAPNDVGATTGNQSGILLPKSGDVWKLFTPHAPVKGEVRKHPVRVKWPDGRFTDSVVTWYGAETRSEYRLTRFGRDFPFRTPDMVGALFVLVPVDGRELFHAYILDKDEDVEEVQTQLGLSIINWSAFPDNLGPPEDEDKCLERAIRRFAASLSAMPKGDAMSAEAREIARRCVNALDRKTLDVRLMRWIRTENRLFFSVERKVWTPEVTRLFKNIDDFLKVAKKIGQARSSRAGRMLENHMHQLLTDAGVKHEMRKYVDGTRPDILIPGKSEYEDKDFPTSKLFMVASKRTCKERWTQVLREARRIPVKHLLTIQEGVPSASLAEMRREKVVLVVPASLHSKYVDRSSVLTVAKFVQQVKAAQAKWSMF